MIAHTLGNPFNLSAVKAFCDRHGLWLVEDNCDALGTTYTIGNETRFTGTWGDIGTSSFYPPHHMTMMQAFAIAEHLLNEPMERDLIIDASVYGIGRGAGNLNTELIAKYMNRALNRSYRIEPLMEVFDRYLKDVFHRVPWGYSPGFFTTACYNANPNYASFYEQELGLSARQIEELLSAMTPEERVIYKKATAEKYLHALVE